VSDLIKSFRTVKNTQCRHCSKSAELKFDMNKIGTAKQRKINNLTLAEVERSLKNFKIIITSKAKKLFLINLTILIKIKYFGFVILTRNDLRIIFISVGMPAQPQS
jgi:hypothetical protein